MKCNSIAAVRFLRSKYVNQMKPAHLAYLNLVPDNQQLPAVLCSMATELDGDICMYGKSASSGVESMNRANDDIRRQTAVEILNAALVLIKKESMHFHRAQSDAHKQEVWSEEKPLTPRGMSVMEDLLKNVILRFIVSS